MTVGSCVLLVVWLRSCHCMYVHIFLLPGRRPFTRERVVRKVVPGELRSRARRGVHGLRRPDQRRLGRRGRAGSGAEGLARSVLPTRGARASQRAMMMMVVVSFFVFSADTPPSSEMLQ